MMRALFFLLLLANLLLFAWLAGYVGKPDEVAPKVARLGDVAPERLALLAPDGAAKLVQGAKAELKRVCLEWGSFGNADAQRVQDLIDPLNLGPRLTLKKIEETAGFWVFFPPQGNKASADKKIDEIKRLGVSDYFIVQEAGANQWAISLGVFKTEDAAKNYLTELSNKGVKTARHAARSTAVTKTLFQMRELDTRLVARFEEWKKDFPNQELKECT